MIKRDAAMDAAIRAGCMQFGIRCRWPQCGCADMPVRIRAAIAAWQAAQPAPQPPRGFVRKVVSVQVGDDWIYAVADDGTLWDRDARVPEGWKQLLPLPQPPAEVTGRVET